MRPLYDCIKKYAKGKNKRYHMPAHNGAAARLFLHAKAGALYASSPYDITELCFSDNLQAPIGVIKQAEVYMAKAYGAEDTLFFAGGATDAVQTAMYCVRDRKVAFFADVHKSFYSAGRIFGIQVEHIESKTELEKADFGALVITSPNYFGEVKDIDYFAKLCEKKAAILIVDESHGAHFAFSSLLPNSSVKSAQFVINGMHKTLPVFTGGALLHLKKEFSEQAREARKEIISTSPSYLVMASMDFARDLFERKGEKMYAELFKKIEKAKSKYPQVNLSPSADFSRIVIVKNGAGLALDSYLQCNGIWCEASDENRVVLIVTPFNGSALKNVFKLVSKFEGKNSSSQDLSTLVGKISVNEVGIYPPGVPILQAGEEITTQKAELLGANYSRLFGLVDGKILTK